MSEHGLNELSSMIEEQREIFRIKLGYDPPVMVDYFEVRLKPNENNYRCVQRLYAPIQRAFISNTIKELENIGAVLKSTASRWEIPSLALPKPGSMQL